MSTNPLPALILDALNATEIWPQVRDQLEAERDQRVRRLVLGCESWDEYLRTAGEVRGIQLVLDKPVTFRPLNAPRTGRAA